MHVYLTFNHIITLLYPFFLGTSTNAALSTVPLVQQTLEIIDQIPPLLRIIAEGKSEFEPSPVDTKEVCR